MTDPSANKAEPILTELHDTVIDTSAPPGGRKPIWIDEVDELFEFTDEPTDPTCNVSPPPIQ